MPFVINPANNQPVYVPGVYSTVKTVGNFAGPAPVYHVPIIVADVDEGVPYSHDDDKEPAEPALGGFRLLTSSSAAAAFAGTESDAEIFARYAFRHGLPFAYHVTAQALTRASVVATSAGPVNEIKLFAAKWGVRGSWIKIAAPSGTSLQVTPPRHFSLVTSDISVGDARVYVKTNAWAEVGQVVELGDNATGNETATIKEVGQTEDANGQRLYYIDLTAGTSGSFDVADYAAVALYDVQDTQDSGALSGDALIDWVNETTSNTGLKAARGAAYTGAALIAVAAALPIKDQTAWATPVTGTSPASTDINHNDLIAWLNGTGLDAFKLRYQQVPRTFAVTSSDTSQQAAWRDWATTMRSNGEPVSINVGCGWGDTVLAAGDDTDPVFRAAALNSENVMLAAGGLDRYGANLSTSAAVFGRRVQGGIGHNLTQDDLVYTEVEIEWNERGSQELTSLHRGGVCTYRLRSSSPFNYVISQGLSTLQRNTVAWNTDDDTTCLVMQRDNADAVDADIVSALDGSQLGAEVTPNTIAATIVARVAPLRRRGWLQDRDDALRISSIALDGSGNGYNASWTTLIPSTVDFITGRTDILLGV